jgi:hypothetical protein
MKATCIIAALAPLISIAGCSSSSEIDVEKRRVSVETQTVQDYVEVGELESVQHIRVYNHDSWSYLTDHFIIYKARDGEYLVEFRRRCRELRDNMVITGDHRYDHNRLRVNEDTIRGCRIGTIYPLTEAQATELRNLGTGPGGRN